jgi:hypothetical protein
LVQHGMVIRFHANPDNFLLGSHGWCSLTPSTDEISNNETLPLQIRGNRQMYR